MICKDPYIQCQDILQHILYSGSAEPLLRSLIAQSIDNIAQDYPTDGVRRALARFSASIAHSPAGNAPAVCDLAHLRVIFFVLLNRDSRMRNFLCSTRVYPHIPPLCPFKACRLYDQLREGVLVDWIKNETVGTLELVESLKDSYLVA